MIHAKMEDFETVKEIFYQHKKWFPHIRTDYMRRMITRGRVVLCREVIITYHFYKRKQRIGNVLAQQGDCILHQIAHIGFDNILNLMMEKQINKKEILKALR